MFDSAHITVLQHDIAVAGSEQAFLQLYRHFSPFLKKFAYSICSNQEDAEEIIEDVFVRIWVKRKTLDQIENLKLYLYVATRNFSLNYCRSKRGIQQFTIDQMTIELLDLNPDPLEKLIQSERKETLNNAIENLPHRCKIIFKLVKIDGLKQKEVADLLDLNIKTIENQISIAIKKLGQTISSHLDPIEKQAKIT
jgi:RNA polymerase sigma-70 factor (ECF subfamily)